jgi:co-chaperonin GroES (HSP10)
MLRIKDIKPMYTKILTTTNKYTQDQTTGVIVDASKLEGRYKEYQTVVRIGNSVRDIKEGDVVFINPTRYIRRKYDKDSLREDFVENPIISIDIPTVTMDDEDYFMIDESDVAYIITDYEEVPDPTPNTIIMPKSKEIKL